MSPAGQMYFIEAKLGGGEAHFAAIAEVESLARSLAESEGGREVVPILVTNLAVAPSVSEIAADVGVQVLTTTHTEAAAIAAAVVDLLASSSSTAVS